MHSFNNIFSHYSESPDLNDVKNTCSDLPVPDMFIHLKVSADEMIKRVNLREDAPWTGLSDNQWLKIQQTTEEVYEFVFDSIGLNIMDEQRYISIKEREDTTTLSFNFIKKFI